MKRAAALLTLLSAAAVARAAAPDVPVPSRPVATYSIVARDAATGQLGVAVQSHWFSVGAIVPWAEAGVGAVATQSFVDPSYGPLGLSLMRVGRSADEALAGLLAADGNRDVRQVAMVDAAGRTAVHTGAKCIAAAGHVEDEALSFTAEANLMSNDRVWPAMAAAYRKAAAQKADLAERLLRALEAAEAAGGDIRGKQSAAIVVVSGTSTGKPWVDRLFDLRVEDSPAPLPELRRLVTRARAYNRMNRGDELAAEQKWEDARAEYQAAAEMVPEESELPFWQAVTLFTAGREAEALPIFERVFRVRPEWAELVPRLPAAGLLPDDPKKIGSILAVARRPKSPAKK